MFMRTNQPHWYVVQCKPRQETRALEHLERQGFTCYFPTLIAEKLRHRQKLETREPLFPGYLFIRLNDANDNWYPIRSTRGVRRIVRFNEYPVPVQDEIIQGISERLGSEPPRVAFLQPGERVRITDGAFSQLDAIFVSNDGDERVVLLMNLLQREQQLSFPVSSIRKLV